MPNETVETTNESNSVASAVASAVAHNVHPHTFPVEEVFKFRTRTDDLGQKLKRPNITAVLPIPTVEGIHHALRDEKQRNYVINLLQEAIKTAAREQVDDEEQWLKQGETLDTSKLTLEYLANVPASEKAGASITPELWEEFARSYVAVMVPLTGRTEEKVAKQASFLVRKFAPVKTNKPTVKWLTEQLDLFAANATAEMVESFEPIFTYLWGRSKTYMEADEAVTLESLQ